MNGFLLEAEACRRCPKLGCIQRPSYYNDGVVLGLFNQSYFN